VLRDRIRFVKASPSDATERRIAFAAVAFCALCVAYFFMLDHLLFSSADFSPIFRFLLTNFDVKAAWIVLGIALFATLWSRPTPVARIAHFIGKHPFGLAFASAAAIGSAAITVYHTYPLSMDEYAAIFQSKIFASGHVVTQVPRDLIDWLVVRGFNGAFLFASPETGKVMEAYWPGFALLLTPFQLFHMAWLCNALLSSLALYLVFWITNEITDDIQAAGWAMLFTLASSAFIASGLSYYSMQAHLTANLLFVALLVKPAPYRALGAGLVGSFALVLHNPVPHTLFAIPWIAALGMQRQRRKLLLALLAGYLPGLVVGFLWLALRTEIGASSGKLTELSDIASAAFAWPDATLINMRSAALVKMWVWAMPCLFALAALGSVKCRADWRVRLMVWSSVVTCVGYLFVSLDQGHGWGYRYFHSAWGTIPILAGCAMSSKARVSSRLVSFAGASAGLSLLFLVPFQMGQIDRFVSQHLAQLGPPRRPGNNVYFIHPQGGFYVADMVQFDPFLRGSDLFLVSHGNALDEQLVRLNWPNATKVQIGHAADQWYLGPVDQRTLSQDGIGKHFTIAKIPH
jgi:hypothetical protein